MVIEASDKVRTQMFDVSELVHCIPYTSRFQIVLYSGFIPRNQNEQLVMIAKESFCGQCIIIGTSGHLNDNITVYE